MTEYDYSPAGYERHIEKQESVRKWTQETAQSVALDPFRDTHSTTSRSPAPAPRSRSRHRSNAPSTQSSRSVYANPQATASSGTLVPKRSKPYAPPTPYPHRGAFSNVHGYATGSPHAQASTPSQSSALVSQVGGPVTPRSKKVSGKGPYSSSHSRFASASTPSLALGSYHSTAVPAVPCVPAIPVRSIPGAPKFAAVPVNGPVNIASRRPRKASDMKSVASTTVSDALVVPRLSGITPSDAKASASVIVTPKGVLVPHGYGSVTVISREGSRVDIVGSPDQLHQRPRAANYQSRAMQSQLSLVPSQGSVARPSRSKPCSPLGPHGHTASAATASINEMAAPATYDDRGSVRTRASSRVQQDLQEAAPPMLSAFSDDTAPAPADWEESQEEEGKKKGFFGKLFGGKGKVNARKLARSDSF